MSYIQPDKIYKVPIEGGELQLSGSLDVIHHFPPLGAYMLKYYDIEAVPPRVCNILLSEESAAFLMRECHLGMVERTWMGEVEHSMLLDYQAAQLTDGDFGL